MVSFETCEELHAEALTLVDVLNVFAALDVPSVLRANDAFDVVEWEPSQSQTRVDQLPRPC